jgi:hypothetical protein
MEKHEVDPTAPAALPEVSEQLVSGAEVEAEGVESPVTPEQITETLSPEQEEKIAQLTAEDIALDFLGRAADTNTRIANMTKAQTRLRLDGKDQARQTSLGERIEKSERNRSAFDRVAKKHFAMSLGIETEEIIVEKFVQAKGVKKDVKEVVATEPARQAELTANYKPFLTTYKGKRRREARRSEITQEIAAVKTRIDPTSDITRTRLGEVAVVVHETQGDDQQAPAPLTDVVYIANHPRRLADLVSPEFDPEQVFTMAEYLGEIGTRMAIAPREDSTDDRALNVHGKDFARAALSNIADGLYWTDNRSRPKKLVVKVTEWYCDLDTSIYRGVVPFSTDVTVTEELYEAIVGNPAWFSHKIANRTEKANPGPVIEKNEDLGGESALYGLADKHPLLEVYDKELLEERHQLVAVSRSLNPDLAISPRRVKNLEAYRLAAITAIHTMVRLAGKVRGYGTNETQDTWNAVFSETHRSREAPRNFKAYTDMAIDYNDAVRGKINQSIHGIGNEIAIHAPFAINNIDRVYKDKDSD